MVAWKGVVFDLDGTLADTPRAITTIMLKVLADRDRHPDEALVRATVGTPLAGGFARLLDVPRDHPDVASAAADYQREFRAHLLANVATLAYPGVVDGVRELRSDGRLLGVATSKPQGAAERILGLMGLAEDFPVVAGDDTVHSGKPDPEMALHVAKHLGLDPRECVVVGDGLADVAMATAAGMAVIGVSYGVATAAQLADAGAEHVVDSFDELVGLVLAHD